MTANSLLFTRLCIALWHLARYSPQYRPTIPRPPASAPRPGSQQLTCLCPRQFNNRSPSLMTEARYAAYLTVTKSLTRTLEGGAKNAHPSGFSRIAEKRRRAAPPLFQYLLKFNLTPCVKTSAPGHQRSGHQVRSKSKTDF